MEALICLLYGILKQVGHAPVNLGQSINTSSHEWYPFLDQYHNLYFSSSGHMGYGGYDIYVCFFNGTGWGEPQNLSRNFNPRMMNLVSPFIQTEKWRVLHII